MKFLRILLAALLVLSMVLPFASCAKQPLVEEPLPTETQTQETTEEEEAVPGVEESAMPLTEYDIAEIQDSIRLLGERTGYNDKGELVTEWSGSGFETNVVVGEEGTDLRIGFRCNYAARWNVYVDGEMWGERVSTSNGNKKQIVARGIPAGPHNIRFVKDSEPGVSRNNYNNILTFAFNGEFAETPADNKLYLEFIGDGYLTGFGAVPKGSGTGKKELEETSFIASLPYLTAQALGADYSVVAHSEIGLKTKAGNFDLVTLYENRYAYRDLDVLYNPDRIPNAIIIHAGMDDTLSTLTQGQFIVAAENFIKQIRSHYGDRNIPVIWLYNTLYHTVRTGEIKALVQKMGPEANVHALEMYYGNSGGGTDTVDYPNAEEHQLSADILIPYLQKLLGR